MKHGLSGADTRQTVFNYFAAEIFDRAPFEQRRLLAQTAFPPHLSAAAAIEHLPRRFFSGDTSMWRVHYAA
jgi:ATP/maltotriose-dependent transcriptional regulator MalT